MKRATIFKFCIVSWLLFIVPETKCQIGIGTATPRGALEVNSSTNGFVPPQVALTAANVAAPVVNPQGGALINGTIVYNTATAGTAPNNVIPGFYYWNGSNWLLLTSQNVATQTSWSVNGNGGTAANTNFMGTTDAVDFVMKTNNSEVLRITSNSLVGIGTTTPSFKFDVQENVANNLGRSRFYNNGVTSRQDLQIGANGAGNIYFGTDGANSIFASGIKGYIDNRSGGRFVFATNGNEQATLDPNGNLGIGNNAPSGKIHVVATGGNGNPGSWDSTYAVFGETGTTGNALGLGFNTSVGGSEYGYISSLKPGTAWKDLRYRALNHIFINGGTNEVFRTTGTFVGIGTTTPNRILELNSGALATPPLRLTQQRANTAATSTSGDNTKSLVIDNNGDIVTKINEKRYFPSNCATCIAPFPYTLPADLTTYEMYDANWSGNSQSNTTLPDFILPTAANAIAAGHKYGDVVVIHRGSAYNVVIGTTNTNLAAVLSLSPTTSVGFALGIDKWYRVF